MSQASGFSLNLAYPMSDPGRAVLGRFAERNREQIAEGDMKAFGNLSAADAMEALSTGSYQGLEGIDFGTSFGRPVAKLPNGAVIQVSAGEMLAAIRKREATRRQVVSKAVEQINRDEFAAQNEDVLEGMLENALALEQISPDTADSYRAFYKLDPMGVLAYVAGVDLADKRQAKTLAARARTENYNLLATGLRNGFAAYRQRITTDIANNRSNQNFEAASRSGSTLAGVEAIVGLMTGGNAMERSFTPQNLDAFADAVRTLANGNAKLDALLVRIRETMLTDDEGYEPSRETLDQRLEQEVGAAADIVNRTLSPSAASIERNYLKQVIMQASDPTASPGAPQRATFDSTVEANKTRAIETAIANLDDQLRRKPIEGNQRTQREHLIAFLSQNDQALFGQKVFASTSNLSQIISDMSAEQSPLVQDTLNLLLDRGLVFQDIDGNFHALENDMRKSNQAIQKAREEELGVEPKQDQPTAGPRRAYGVR